MPFLFLIKWQNLKLSSAANCRWRFNSKSIIPKYHVVAKTCISFDTERFLVCSCGLLFFRGVFFVVFVGRQGGGYVVFILLPSYGSIRVLIMRFVPANGDEDELLNWPLITRTNPPRENIKNTVTDKKNVTYNKKEN